MRKFRYGYQPTQADPVPRGEPPKGGGSASTPVRHVVFHTCESTCAAGNHPGKEHEQWMPDAEDLMDRNPH